jgi:hypothetical protein
MFDAGTEFTIAHHLITQMVNRSKCNVADTWMHNG